MFKNKLRAIETSH